MTIEGTLAQLKHCYKMVMLSLLCCCSTSTFAASVDTGPVTVNVTVQPGLVVVGSLAADYPFNPIDTSTMGAQTITVSPFYAYANDTATNVSISLTTGGGQSDANSTWMNPDNDPSNTDKVYYDVVYYPCAASAPAVSLSENTVSPVTGGINCSDHTCTIGNAYANNTACAGNPGHLEIIRKTVTTMPTIDLYTGEITLEESLL